MELAGVASESGYTVVALNHYAPAGETDLQLINTTSSKYINDTVNYVLNKY